MNVKDLTYQEKLQILKDIFDSTNITLNAAYGAEGTITSDDIYIVEEKDRQHYNYDDKSEFLIAITTGICTG